MRLSLLLSPIFLILASGLLPAQESPPAVWKAGVASTIITPDEPLWMAGYAGRKEPANGKITDLHAKVLVLEDASGKQGVYIALDLIGVDRLTAAALCHELARDGFKREQIAINCSHTHSGPVVGKNLGPIHYLVLDAEQQDRIDRYEVTLRAKVVQTVRDARSRLAPARLQWGSGLATFAVNRRENKPYEDVPARREAGTLKGPVDHDVPVLTVRDTGDEGRLRAILFGYACHATVLSGGQWCADYPGYAQVAVEKTFPGATALFWAGCGADQNPLPRSTVALAEAYGAELAESVAEVVAAPMEEIAPTLATHYREVEAPLASPPTAGDLRKAVLSQRNYEAANARLLLKRLEENGRIEGAYPFPVGRWRLGTQVDWIFLGGEVVVDYATRLKREGQGTATWVAGYSNDVMAYVPSLRVLREGGYEGGDSNVYYGLPGLWADSFEEIVISTIHELR